MGCKEIGGAAYCYLQSVNFVALRLEVSPPSPVDPNPDPLNLNIAIGLRDFAVVAMAVREGVRMTMYAGGQHPIS